MSALIKLSDATLAKKVDELGALNAALSELKRKAEAIKDALIASGYGEVEGKLFRAVIVPKTTSRLDTKLAKTFLSPAEIAACTKSSESISVTLYDL